MTKTLDQFQQNYSREQFLAFYEAWSKAQPGTKERIDHWHSYCDARDGLKQGVSQSRYTFAMIGAN